MALFEMKQHGDPKTFVIELNDSSSIAHARKVLAGEETREIHVHGRIIKQPKPYNPGFSYHLDPITIQFFEMAIEVCDASMSYVEDHLDEVGGAFLPGGHWCPWTSHLTREIV